MSVIYVTPIARHVLTGMMIIALLVPLTTSDGSRIEQDAVITVIKVNTLREDLWESTSTRQLVSPIEPALLVMLDASFVQMTIVSVTNVKITTISWTIRPNVKAFSLVLYVKIPHLLLMVVQLETNFAKLLNVLFSFTFRLIVLVLARQMAHITQFTNTLL